ncbi:MAG: transglutaminase-like domain-containing protein [Phycisphaerales bacterium]
MNPRFPLVRLLTLATAILGLSLRTLGGDAPASDRYYVVQMLGKKAGHARLMQAPDGENLKTLNEMALEIKRGPIAVKLAMTSEWLETAAGEPLSFRTLRALGASPVEKTYTFRKDDITVKTLSQGRVTESTLPRPAPGWLPPGAAARKVAAALKAGESTIELKSLDEGMGGGLQVSTTTYTIAERETTVEVLGKSVPAIRWSSEVDLMPGAKSVEFVDATGLVLRSEVDFGGLKLVQIAADRALALSPTEAPEFLVSTLVKPDRPINKPRELQEAVYLLSSSAGDLPDFPLLPSQSFERINPQSGRLRVVRAHSITVPKTDLSEQTLGRSSMIDPTDQAILDLTAKALKGKEKAPDAERAETLRRFVHRTISRKNLDVGFATASEVARTRTGDCTEHGVLLAALLRATGLHARVALGLEYVDSFGDAKGVFGYHMWAQAYLPGSDGVTRWIDLDATLDDATPFDAAHITIATSSLAEADDSNSLVTMAPLIGRLAITVERTAP